MSDIIDLSALPLNVPSLCIPRVFPNITRERVFQCFKDLDIGFIERIDMIPRTAENGEKYLRVFVHMRWSRSEQANKARSRVLGGHEIKIIYDEPWFWKVSANRSVSREEPARDSRDSHRPRATLALEDEEDIEESIRRIKSQNDRHRNERRAPATHASAPRDERRDDRNRDPRYDSRRPAPRPAPHREAPRDDRRPPTLHCDERRDDRHREDRRQAPHREAPHREATHREDRRRDPRDEEDEEESLHKRIKYDARKKRDEEAVRKREEEQRSQHLSDYLPKEIKQEVIAPPPAAPAAPAAPSPVVEKSTTPCTTVLPVKKRNIVQKLAKKPAAVAPVAPVEPSKPALILEEGEIEEEK